MLFDIFSKKKRILKKFAKARIDFLLTKLETYPDKIEVYLAVRNTFAYLIQHGLGKSPEEAKKRWDGVSLADMIDRIKLKKNSEPMTIFLILVEIHARLLTKEDFTKLIKEVMPDFSQEHLDAMIFKNANICLQFKNSNI